MYGANVNDKRTDTGASFLMVASQEGHVKIFKLLLSHGANVKDLTNDGVATAISISASDTITYILRKWPISMAILIFKELSIYYQSDASTMIDLYQYMAREDLVLQSVGGNDHAKPRSDASCSASRGTGRGLLIRKL